MKNKENKKVKKNLSFILWFVIGYRQGLFNL